MQNFSETFGISEVLYLGGIFTCIICPLLAKSLHVLGGVLITQVQLSKQNVKADKAILLTPMVNSGAHRTGLPATMLTAARHLISHTVSLLEDGSRESPSLYAAM